MNPLQEIVTTLLSQETINKVKQQFKTGQQIVPVDAMSFDFRLFKAEAGNINLELLSVLPVGLEDLHDFSVPGRRRISQTIMYFKPIGFFTQKKEFLSNSIEVTVVKEFENSLNMASSSPQIKINRLSLTENALLAASSMEALVNAQKMSDTSFISNGLKCDIYMANEGFPQVFLDDKYGLSGGFIGYFPKERNFSVRSTLPYRDMFDKYFSMSLMTAFKRM